MKMAGQRKTRISDRINSLVSAEKPLRHFAGNVSKIAKNAMDEASSLSLERVEIREARRRVRMWSDRSVDDVAQSVEVIRPGRHRDQGTVIANDPPNVGEIDGREDAQGDVE